jgi:hypothetical protein
MERHREARTALIAAAVIAACLLSACGKSTAP